MSEQTVHDFNAVLANANDDRNGISFRMDNGEEFTVPPPLEWPDEVLEIQGEAADKPSAALPVRIAKALLGDQYDAYRAAGGNAMKFMKFYEQVSGSNTGESSAS